MQSKQSRPLSVKKLIEEFPSLAGWFALSPSEQEDRVTKDEAGSEWRNIITGKVVRIGSVSRYGGVTTEL